MKHILTVLFVMLFQALSFGQQTPKFQFIRNATFILEYNGTKFLFDPMFAKKGGHYSITGKLKSPLVDLPISENEILKNADAVVVTHTHFDHFDEFAAKALDKNTPVIHKSFDKKFLMDNKFTNLTQINDSLVYNNTTLISTYAQHGSGEILAAMGEVSGYILKAENQPTIYIVGDAIWTQDIYTNIKTHKPDYIVINLGGALVPNFESTPIIMDEFQALSVLQEAKDAKVIAIHMDAIDHCATTRAILKAMATENNISNEKLLIPNDGQTLELK